MIVRAAVVIVAVFITAVAIVAVCITAVVIVAVVITAVTIAAVVITPVGMTDGSFGLQINELLEEAEKLAGFIFSLLFLATCQS